MAKRACLGERLQTVSKNLEKSSLEWSSKVNLLVNENGHNRAKIRYINGNPIVNDFLSISF